MTTIGKLREIDDIDKYEQVVNIARAAGAQF